ncbi:MAG: metallophosphoesterase [candidate division Zixibacteria bacterium]|nr:metallophosphoesterase [candidate division Zixibacteria bacterium]
MRIFFPIIFAAVLILFLGMMEVILLRLLNREWWQNRKIRRSAFGLPLAGVVTLLIWAAGEYYILPWLALPGAVLAVLVFVLEVALMLSLPVSGVIRLLGKLVGLLLKRGLKKETHEKIDPHRRVFLKGAAAVVPLMTMAMGVTGVARAFHDIRVYLRPIAFRDLPPGWEGLRLLHLTDLHLRQYVTLNDLEQVLSDAESFEPDLLLVTGDVADDLDLLPEALAMMSAFNAPFGCYACLGNHEYFRGLYRVRKIFGRSRVPLLVNRTVSLSVRGTELRLGGIDDPVTIRGVNKDFFRRSIDETFSDNEPSAFSLLMSHRPEALEYASEKGLDLVLAGHTHGSQVGLLGRSAFENLWPDRYLWGHYQREKTHLYTSSGVGHWFPFRLGCPTEAPVIELRRA